MKRFPLPATPVSLLLALAVMLAGCTDSASKPPTGKSAPAAAPAGHQHDHEHGDGHEHDQDPAMPADLPAGIAALKAHRQEIKAALAEGSVEKAHDPLHHVGELLEALPALGRTAGLTAEQLATLQQSVDQLLTAFGQMDEDLHDGKAPDYDKTAAQIDAAIAALEGLAAPH